MSWNPKYIFLILTTIIITYFSGIGISKAHKKGSIIEKKFFATVSIALNLMILFFFKYFDFAIDSINRSLQMGDFKLLNPTFDVLLPV